jgi:hypothetical protein
MPRHNMIIGGKRTPGGLMGASLAKCYGRCGRAEPAPPRGGSVQGMALGWKWPSGENPGIMRRAVFSEGRTLCVRIARPVRMPRHSKIIGGKRHGGRMGTCSGGGQFRLICGRAEPAPPRGVPG